MKKIITILFLCFGTAIFAQKKYSDIESLVVNAIDSYENENDELLFLKILKSNFDYAKKLKESHLKKNNVGIAFLLSKEDPVILPAKYSYKDGKINTAIMEGSSEDTKDYVQKYLHKMETIGNTAIFKKMMQTQNVAKGIYEENKSEFYCDESSKVTFIRGNNDWMYCVTVEDAKKENPNIIIYAFKISISGEDIFNAGNSKEEIEERRQELIATKRTESKNFPLYHDVRTDEIRLGIEKILEIPPFKTDKKLLGHYKNIEEPITRYSIKNHVEEFKFFLSLNIPNDFLEKHFNKYEDEEVFVIKHLSAHSLADFYFGNEQYEKAIEYYKKCIFEFPYEETSGTVIVRDAERILYDISKSYYQSGKKDEAYGFLIGLVIDSQQNYNLAAKTINEYMQEKNEDRNKLKTDIDKALKTIKEGKNNTYTFIFRNKEIFFFPMMPESQQEYEKSFKESSFYKEL